MKTWVMSGASSGFGVEWLRELDRRQEVRWLLLVRNVEASRKMLLTHPLRGSVDLIRCNLASFASVQGAISDVQARTDRLDGLINNAGVFPDSDRRLNQDGIETSLAVNVLAPHQLFQGLGPLLLEGSTPRLINTASFRHRNAKLNRQDFQLSRGYSDQLAYSNTKLYLILWTRALARRLHGTGLTACCFDPGIVDTPMLKQAMPRLLNPLYPLLRPLIARSPAHGAETGVFLSTVADPSPFNGKYVKDGRIGRPSRVARDEVMAEWVWNQCEQLVSSVVMKAFHPRKETDH